MSDELNTTDSDQSLRERQLDREDFEIQTEAAWKSALKGNYATARAELQGAITVIDAMEKRHG